MSGADQVTLQELGSYLPDNLRDYLRQRDGATQFARDLPATYAPSEIAHHVGEEKKVEQRIWELVGLHYLRKERPQPMDAFYIFAALYDHLLVAQEEWDDWIHKGMPLVWMYECLLMLGFPALSKRYLMMTLCEDSIIYQGKISPEKSGVYFRLVWSRGMSDVELNRYSREIHDLWEKFPLLARYPEWLLLNIDQDWMTEFPSIQESSYYFANERFVGFMLASLGEGSGKNLETLAKYVLSCIPGCRTSLRPRSGSTDYDVVCSLEGLSVDFRSEIGRYFVVECKDRKDPADFSTIAKFCRVLDSTKCRFGIIFSTSGISGKGRAVYGEREQIKAFQDRGMVIVVVDLSELHRLAAGTNFISMLRSKYEAVRLDLLDAS